MTSTSPLSHHDVLALAEPFARRGRRVDLAASDRAARRLVFRHPERGDDTLQLDDLGTGTLRLTRTLVHPSGLQATLEAMGPSAAALLERVEQVEPASQFSAGEGWVVARCLLVRGLQEILVRGQVRVDGLDLTMRISPVPGVSADITLAPTGPDAYALPEDLLAVLGWDWARLIRQREAWISKLRLRGGPDRRSRTAASALLQAARHLARTLAEPPARYHERLLWARWGVVARRSIPLMTPPALVATVLAMPRLDVEGNPLWLLLYHVPTVVIALSFLLQELPQFEIPPWPRRSAADSWRQPRDVGGDAGRPAARPSAP